ncbi:hypothetical protein D9756_006542 [Leucocoprinus leucothites]|uniref:Arabinogalactan endo-beta-1,4-galactanase n=1 Tax=Leucocoprinus leucothites TaxID=201217 RepID=A0A8H5LGZ0_9AGAR|nr:hypothetical protein D9756_006542 [Leucoagaricus leucothites]
MSILVDLHYSDTWADPGHQAIPSSWPTNLNGLNTQIWTYTRDVVNAFANQGTPIRFIQVGPSYCGQFYLPDHLPPYFAQIGNEINDGLLWPTGKISSKGFSRASQPVLHSASTGVCAATSGSNVHIANGWESSGVNFFWNGIFLQGQFATSDFDLFGFSFYPFYNSVASYSALQSTLTGIVNKFGKDVMVVETDWPATGSCSGVTLSERSIPISVAGQTTWVNGIKNVLAALPGGHGTGIVYWEPGWIGNAGLGSSCSDNLLVDGSGVSRASMSMFSS